MDTKWKNKLLLISWFLLFTFGIGGVIGTLFGTQGYREGNYFQSPSFSGHIDEFVSYVNAFEVSYVPKNERLENVTVSEEEIKQYRTEHGLEQNATEIENEYQQRIQDAREQDNQEWVAQLEQERDDRIAAIKDDEYIKEQILKEKKDRIDRYYDELEGYRYSYTRYRNAFLYFLENKETGEVFTNLDAKNLQEAQDRLKEKDLLTNKSFPNSNQGYLTISNHPLIHGYEDLIDGSSNTQFEGKIAVPNQSLSMITQEYRSYQNQQIVYWIYTISVFLALIASVIIEQKKKMLHRMAPERWRKFYQYIPIDVAIALGFITGMFTLVLFFDHYFFMGYSTYIWGILEGIFYHVIGLAIFLALSIIQGFYLYDRLKKFSNFKQEWEKAWLVKFYNMLRGAFTNRKVGTQVLLIVTTIFAFGFGSVVSLVETDFILLYLIAFVSIGIPLFIMIIRKTGYFNLIIKYANSLAKGEFEPDLKVKGKSVLAQLAADLNTMKSGVKTSQNAQAKSERLKTELITNVSHDLRTPLTSIMTYSELLKNPSLSDDEKQSYIEIIDRKSKRLKVLIDDLFEASKMASGNIELVKERVDLVQLLQQALAEYNESIKESTIQFRTNVPDTPVFAMVDGQKLWRVFENLIGNILKYSLDHSRAYVQLKEENGRAVISFKNVSEYELSANVDELFERFKRGDESRHTDGSGLGLAIAKSIIDLHEGTMDIDTDGDLFKVTIKV